jgi:hypothetical protein
MTALLLQKESLYPVDRGLEWTSRVGMDAVEVGKLLSLLGIEPLLLSLQRSLKLGKI